MAVITVSNTHQRDVQSAGVMRPSHMYHLFPVLQSWTCWTSRAVAPFTTLYPRTGASWASRRATSSSSQTKLTRTGTRAWSTASPAFSPSTTWRSSSHCRSEDGARRLLPATSHPASALSSTQAEGKQSQLSPGGRKLSSDLQTKLEK